MILPATAGQNKLWSTGASSREMSLDLRLLYFKGYLLQEEEQMQGKPIFYLTDVFGWEKYSGNQLATFVNCGSMSAQEMQKIAREINFSETTFILSSFPVNGSYPVRIFTPKGEVEFAGHPTLGTAHILREKVIRSPVDTVVLNLKVGEVPVRFSDGRNGRRISWMTQIPPRFGASLQAENIAGILSLKKEDIDDRWPVQEVSTGLPHVMVPLKTLDALRRISVNKEAYYSRVRAAWAKVILAFAPEPYEDGHTLAVRVFGDYFGIAEDAATGSGNGALAAYLFHNGYLGKRGIDIAVGQGYEMGRPSTLFLRAHDVAGKLEVSVGGSVVEVAQGTWG